MSELHSRILCKRSLLRIRAVRPLPLSPCVLVLTQHHAVRNSSPNQIRQTPQLVSQMYPERDSSPKQVSAYIAKTGSTLPLTINRNAGAEEVEEEVIMVEEEEVE